MEIFIFPEKLNLTLRLRYRDGDGWIVARLVQVNLETGAESQLVHFDSRGFDVYGNEEFVVKSLGASYTGELDFVGNAYYVELTLSALVSPIRPLPYPPAVSIIQLWNYM